MRVLISRETSTKIKGLAILMMVFHHLFSYPQWWKTPANPPYMSLFSVEVIAVVGECMKACIPIYAFVSGFGLFKSCKRRNTREICIWSIKKAASVLINYWIILLPIAVITWISNDLTMPNKGTVLGNLFGFGDLLIPFAWYISFYLLILGVFPIISMLIRKGNNEAIRIGGAIGYSLVSLLGYYGITAMRMGLPSIVLDYLLYSPYVVLGASIASLETTNQLSQDKKRIMNCNCARVILLVIAVGKYLLHGSTKLDLLFVPCFVLAIASLLEQKQMKSIHIILSTLGKHSFNIWLLHCVAFIWELPYHSFIQRIVYFPRLIPLVVCWCILLLLPLSYLISRVMNSINSLR